MTWYCNVDYVLIKAKYFKMQKHTYILGLNHIYQIYLCAIDIFSDNKSM